MGQHDGIAVFGAEDLGMQAGAVAGADGDGACIRDLLTPRHSSVKVTLTRPNYLQAQWADLEPLLASGKVVVTLR